MLRPTLKTVRLLATAAVAALSGLAIAHEGDLKARDFKGAVVAPAWLADEHVGEEAVSPFQSSGVRLMAWFPCATFNSANTSGNDVWGYVSPSGREYALMGLSNGTGFVEVTNPGSSRIIAFIAGPASLWRNVKTYQNYAYSVSEGGGGIQVFNLANIDAGVVTLVNTVDASAATPATHTMIINEQTGYLYRMGGGSNGLRIYSLANPAAPALVATWNPKYTHDGVVYNYTTGPYAGKE
ncbi:MAG: choice-of-anchor B family protein, partial [Gemmatimonadaceae bacterium]|nr:choice-of-anchor B family protein [Gemmatimonadaceae bacterium]